MKRTLALVLALVMAIGLMAFPVSADFKDDAEIKYTEAVDVMSAIGVINGFEDGSFDPDGYLTREQAAKVVAYLMLGAEQADAMSATSAPFDDVAANRWSAGYIAYCVNEGIINGRSETTFDPTGNVTGYEFAKLMLGCLGYSSTIENYTGAEWNINVAKTALTIGLFNGNKGANYNVALTREEAALYAFNMLQADLVDYENRGTIIDLGNGMSISSGASKAEKIADDSDKKNGTIDKDGYVQFAERYFDDLEKTASTPDDFGRPSTKWVYDKDTVGTYSDEPELTYTTATKGSTIYSDLNKPSDADYTYYIDGVVYDEAGMDTYHDFSIGSGVDEKVGGNGTLVEVFEDTRDGHDGDYVVTVVNTYVGTISAWNEADEDKDEDESIDIAPADNSLVAGDITGGSKYDYNFETTKFTEDDADDEIVVLYTIAYDSDDATYYVKSVDAAEMISATPTRVTGTTSFVAGGETYKYNTTCDSKFASGDVKAEKDFDIYFDSYGYVIYTTASGGDSDDYALLLGVDETTEAFQDKQPIVKLLLATGEIVVADLDDDSPATEKNLKDAMNENTNAVIVTYTVNKDGEYSLTIPTQFKSNNTGLLEITKGSAAIYLDTKDNRYYANNKTVFFAAEDTFADSKDADYDVYTGYTNVPSMSERAADTAYVVTFEGNRVAAIFVANAKTSNTVNDDVIAVAVDKKADAMYDTDLGDYYEFEVVNGDTVETMMFEKSTAEALMKKVASGDVGVVLLDSINVDDESVVTDYELNTDYKYVNNGTSKVSDGLVGIGGTRYATSDDCVVFRMDSDAEWSTSTVSSIRNDANDEVSFILDSDDEIVIAIYIEEID